MSRFYADITGGRGTATRQGHAASGIRGHVRGWHSGVRVIGRAVDVDGTSVDVFDVYGTFGSNGNNADMWLCTVTDDTGLAPGSSPGIRVEHRIDTRRTPSL